MPGLVEITHSTGRLHVFACAKGARKHDGSTLIQSFSPRAREAIKAGRVCRYCLGQVAS